MATVTVRALDEQTKNRLRVRAAQNGHSMEQEARNILNAALAAPAVPVHDHSEGEHWVDRILRKVREAGAGGDLELPPRAPMEPPMTFDE